MSEDKKPVSTDNVDRRAVVRKAAYIIPAVLAAVKATERPAYAQTSGAPRVP